MTIEFNPDTDWHGYAKRKPLPMLYSRTGTGATNIWLCWIDEGNVVVEWGAKGGKLQRSVFACEAKNAGRSNATTPAQQARLEAIAKWRKQLKKKYSLTEEATLELNIKPMLAKSFVDVAKARAKKGGIEYPVDVQPKFDGVRCLAYRKDGHVILQSRGGDPYDVEHIRSALEPLLEDDQVLDGEIYQHGMPLQDIISLVKTPQDGSLDLTYQVYDMTKLSGQTEVWLERKVALEAWFRAQRDADDLPGFVVLVKAVSCAHEDSVRAFHDLRVSDGYEGAIIRLHHGLYRFGYRSSELLKLKAFEDAEFEIIGYRTGKGKFLKVPIFNCVTSKGAEFEVTIHGTSEARAALLKQGKKLIGRQMTVRYRGFSNEGKPKIAVGICIRDPGT
jgi:DNA ligase 1